MKYSLNPREIPRASPSGSGYISSYIPPLVTIQIQYSTEQYSAVQYSRAQQSRVQYNNARLYTVAYGQAICMEMRECLQTLLPQPRGVLMLASSLLLPTPSPSYSFSFLLLLLFLFILHLLLLLLRPLPLPLTFLLPNPLATSPVPAILSLHASPGQGALPSSSCSCSSCSCPLTGGQGVTFIFHVQPGNGLCVLQYKNQVGPGIQVIPLNLL